MEHDEERLTDRLRETELGVADPTIVGEVEPPAIVTDDEVAGEEVERPLTAEEKAAGSSDPEGQSALVMEDSELRIEDREASPGTHLEHRTSAEATPPTS